MAASAQITDNTLSTLINTSKNDPRTFVRGADNEEYLDWVDTTLSNSIVSYTSAVFLPIGVDASLGMAIHWSIAPTWPWPCGPLFGLVWTFGKWRHDGLGYLVVRAKQNPSAVVDARYKACGWHPFQMPVKIGSSYRRRRMVNSKNFS
jgi:hypothetical protein